ncbi:MAG: FtsH protease activity modulator HflK [bacterium]
MKFFDYLLQWIKYLLLIFIGIYLLSGFYRIKPYEIGLLRKFGKTVNDHVPPGLHYALPSPFYRIDKIKVKERKRVAIGFEFADSIVPRLNVSSRQGEFLSGDKNIIEVQMALQYYILEPKAYLFRVVEPNLIIKAIAKSHLAKLLAAVPVDKIFEGNGQIMLQHAVSEKTQESLDNLFPEHKRWIKISSVNLQNPPSPPIEVADAFKAVATARQDKERFIREAEGYRNDAMPKVKGRAEEVVQQAQAYRTEKINQAEGEGKRFQDRALEFNKQKEITSVRLYIERMEQVMSRIQKVIVPDDKNNNNLDLRLINLAR